MERLKYSYDNFIVDAGDILTRGYEDRMRARLGEIPEPDYYGEHARKLAEERGQAAGVTLREQERPQESRGLLARVRQYFSRSKQ